MFRKQAYLESRDRLVMHLFGITYEQYLHSKIWAEIRERALSRDGHKCVLCTGEATQVHHVTYDVKTFNGKNIKGLISICRPCHQDIETYPSGKKVNRNEVRRRMFFLADRYGTLQSLLDLGFKRPKPSWHGDEYDLCGLIEESETTQSTPVDQRTQNQATSGLPQADPPAAGTERHDTLCQIPDRTNGVSSRGLPAHALAPDVQAGQPHANGPDLTRTERAARCDQSVSGTDRDEDTRERPGASSLTDLAG